MTQPIWFDLASRCDFPGISANINPVLLKAGRKASGLVSLYRGHEDQSNTNDVLTGH